MPDAKSLQSATTSSQMRNSHSLSSFVTGGAGIAGSTNVDSSSALGDSFRQMQLHTGQAGQAGQAVPTDAGDCCDSVSMQVTAAEVVEVASTTGLVLEDRPTYASSPGFQLY